MQNGHSSIREKEPADGMMTTDVIPSKSVKQLSQLSECTPAKKGAKKHEPCKQFVHGYHKTAPVQ